MATKKQSKKQSKAQSKTQVRKETTALTPFAAKRAEILTMMRPKTQEVAKAIIKQAGVAAKGIISIQYNVGARIAEVVRNPEIYGIEAVTQLADYSGYPGGATALYALKNFADAFTKEYVVQQTSTLMEDGRPLRYGHFLAIMRVRGKDNQQKLLKQTRVNAWGVNQLQKEIHANYDVINARSGGRSPATPTSPAAGLQKLFSVAQQLDNYLPVLQVSVLDKLAELAPDQVTRALLDKFITAEEKLQKLLTGGSGMIGAMDKVKVRLQSVLDQKTETSETSTAAPKSTERATKKSPKKVSTGKKAKKQTASKGGTASRETSSKKAPVRQKDGRPSSI